MLRNDNSSSAESADFSAPTNDSKPMTREVYRNSLNAVQNSEENFVESKEEQPRGVMLLVLIRQVQRRWNRLGQ